MHNSDVIVLGSKTFISTLNELSPYLKFKISFINVNNLKKSISINKLLLCDNEFLDNKNNIDLIKNSECIKILASEKNNKNNYLFDNTITLPTTIKEINSIIETSIAKKKFGENSSIQIKEYLLDKNEKKLKKGRSFLILTEKEVQLLELFEKNTKPISKKKILSLVWHYASDADTHTVETHIYRLRKKIADKFSDEKFIQNNKEGYYL